MSDWTDAPNEIDIRPVVADLIRRYGKDFGIERYCRTPPDKLIDPIFIDEITVDPPGGRSANPDGPWVWCSECERPKFWEGIAITNGLGELYLIGHRCGVQFYGRDRVLAARRVWRAGLDRRRAIERFGAATARMPDYAAAIRLVRRSKSLSALDAARLKLRAAGDLCQRLESNTTLHDGDLVALRPFVDARGHNQLGKVWLGPLQGAAMLRRPAYELAIADRLEAAMAAVAATADPVHQDPSSLQAKAKEVEDAASALTEAWASAARAHEFFGSLNLNRIVDFAEQMRRHYTVTEVEGGLRVRGNGKAKTVPPLQEGSFPAIDLSRFT